jgi:DHA1 family multidrug resistance protein-like MFS transporter
MIPPAPPDALQETREFPYWRANQYALAVATFALAVGFGAAQPFLPLTVRELGVTEHVETWVGYLLGGYFTLSFFLTPLWGVVADHFGRKSMVLRTSLGMGILTLLMPLAPSLGWFMALFLLMGTSNGFVPASQALIATTTPPRRMGRSLGLLLSGTMLGGALGPVVGAALAGWLPTYRHLFYVNGVFVLGAGLLALAFAGETRLRPQHPFRLHLIRDLRVIARIRNLPVLLLINLAYTLTFYGSVTIISVYTLEILAAGGASEPGAVNFWLGVVSMSFTVASGLAVPLWGRLLDRLGAPRLLTLALLCGGVGAVPVALVQGPWQLTIARAAMGVAAVGIGPANVTLIRNLSPPGMEGRVLSYAAAFGSLGMGVGPFLAGQIGPVFGLRAYFVLNAALLLGLLLLWRRSAPRQPAAP